MDHYSIKAVLFDFGGVLAEEGFYNGLIILAHEQGLDVEGMPGAAMQAVYDSGFVLGKGSVKDFWSLVRERTGLMGEDEVLTERILAGFIIRPWMIALVRRLRGMRYIVGILSDQTSWLDKLDEKYHFYKEFDHVFNSYYMGKGKRDPSLFTDIATTLALAPGEILFVDDSAENVARARSSGLQAIHYLERSQFITAIEGFTEGAGG